MLEAPLGVGWSVPDLDFSTMDSEDIRNSILAFVSILNQLIADTVSGLNNLISQLFAFADGASDVSTPHLLTFIHIVCVEAADLMSITMLLEEESFTALSICLSLRALILAVGNGLFIVASSLVRGILRIRVTLSILAAIGQGNLAVAWSTSCPIHLSIAIELGVLLDNADSSVSIGDSWGKDIVTIDHEISGSLDTPWVSNESVHRSGLSRSDFSIRAEVSRVIVPEEVNSLVRCVVKGEEDALSRRCGLVGLLLCSGHRLRPVFKFIIVVKACCKLSKLSWLWLKVFIDCVVNWFHVLCSCEGKKAGSGELDFVHLFGLFVV